MEGFCTSRFHGLGALVYLWGGIFANFHIIWSLQSQTHVISTFSVHLQKEKVYPICAKTTVFFSCNQCLCDPMSVN